MQQLRRIKTGSTIEEDHMRNRQMVVHWIMANSSAIEKVKRDGKTFVRVKDTAAWHEAAGRLLAVVQKIIEEHRGTVSIESEAENGVKVSIKLPGHRKG